MILFPQKPGKLFAHIFDWPENNKLDIPLDSKDIKRVYLLSAPDVDIRFRAISDETVVLLPDNAPDEIASVIVIEHTGQL